MLPEKKKEIFHLNEIRDLTMPFVFADTPAYPQAPLVFISRVTGVFIVLAIIFKLMPTDLTVMFALSVLAALSIIALLFSYLSDARKSIDKYRYTNDGVELETGLLSREMRLLPWSEVQSVRVRVSLFQRIFNTGDIILQLSPSAGSFETTASLSFGNAGSLSQKKTGGETIVLKDVHQPVDKVNLMHRLITAARLNGAKD